MCIDSLKCIERNEGKKPKPKKHGNFLNRTIPLDEKKNVSCITQLSQ